GGGELRAVVVEGHNTHGERHLYTLRGATGPSGTSGAAGFVDSMEKAFYVSPFIEMAGRYTVRIRDEASRLRITINEDPGDGLMLHTRVALATRTLTCALTLRRV